ncbi:M20/M25/M40 family metallo-hydrolase [Dankookia sp. P2]|uniref:M20/M25/M40 family metallo-hydrolase n=1 Tax=Dankookia sp. P2 TaxID=3423955 RepID=UPI003D66F15D
MTAAATIARILADPRFRDAVATMTREHDRTVADIVTLTEIPSPPFAEERRAAAYLEMLRAHGLEEVERDAIGNVMGRRRGSGNGRTVVVAAHLDTVFPAGTDVRVRREGTKLYAPGVGDDTRSLAVNLAFLRAMDAAGIRTRSDILFLGDVGRKDSATCAACGTSSSRAATATRSMPSSPWTARRWTASSPAASAASATASPSAAPAATASPPSAWSTRPMPWPAPC